MNADEMATGEISGVRVIVEVDYTDPGWFDTAFSQMHTRRSIAFSEPLYDLSAARAVLTRLFERALEEVDLLAEESKEES